MIQRRWPLHPRPIEGEALSSWLGRVAATYNLRPEDLLKYDFGYEISTDDLDFNPSDTLLENIMHRSNLSLEKIHNMTFRSWVPFIIDQIDPVNNNFDVYILQYSVLLPVKARSSPALSNWRPWLSNPPIVRACQTCITSDPKNAIHLSWKIPIMLTCPLHGCRLQPCITYSSEHVYWKEEEINDLPVTQEIINMDTRTWKALMTGTVDLPRHSIQAGVWFRLLRSLINELSLPLSHYPSHVHRIKKVWNACEHPIRGGLNMWKPYEYLPFKIQVKLLEAAATAIAMIEAGSLSAPGEHAKLFQADFVDNKDWPSYLDPSNTNDKYQKFYFNELLEQVIEEAKVNRESAESLRGLCLFGRKDPDVIKEIDNLFLELEIPFQFS